MSIFSLRSSDVSQTLNQGVCFKKLAFLGIFILALFIGAKLFTSCYFHTHHPCYSHRQHHHLEHTPH